jgi:molybdopterin molybdotransferase
MSFDEESVRRTSRGDVRLRGFGDLVAFGEAMDWVTRHGTPLDAEEVAIAEAAGRVLARPADAPADLPPFDRVIEDGYAVSSGETIGAGTYNPLLLELRDAGSAPRPGAAVLVAAGMPLPRGADAVIPFAEAQASGPVLEVLGSVAEGVGIERRGVQLRSGAALAPGGRALRPRDLAVLASLGGERVSVVRRPRVKLVISSAKGGAQTPAPDANGPMLRALVERDGGLVLAAESGGDHGAALRQAMAAPGADLLLAAGRTGTGPDDDAPLALAGAGRLDVHGIAVRPGGSAGMGRAGPLPVILLPGDPLACLCAYELFAGEMIRRMGGRDPRLPHPVVEAEVGSKIVSTIGFTELCQVRLADGRAEPTGAPGSGGIASALRADGFVVVPAPLEGHAPGSRVLVHLHS